MTEHPTDKIDHELPESMTFTLSGEALQVLRTEAEITGQHPVDIFLEAVATRHWILERITEGCTFKMTNPDGTIDAITFQLKEPGNGHDMNPLS